MIEDAEEPIRLELGKWYFGFVCKACSRKMGIEEDDLKGGAPYLQRLGQRRIMCPFCGESATYANAEILSFQARGVDQEDRKKRIEELRNALAETKSLAPKLVDKGRNLAEAGQSASDLASALEPLTKNMPDYIAASTIALVAGGIREFNTVAKIQYEKITSDRSLLDLCHANVTSATIGVVISADFDVEFSDSDAGTVSNFQPLIGLLHRGSDVEAVKRSMRTLGLDVTHGSARTPLQLLQSAENAYKRPSADEGYESAVLIPLRESIKISIDELLKRRRVIEPTGSWTKKIMSIGQYCGNSTLSSDYIERVATTTHTLIDRLSGGKGQDMNRGPITTLFDESVSLLQDIFSLIDPQKLRTSKL